MTDTVQEPSFRSFCTESLERNVGSGAAGQPSPESEPSRRLRQPFASIEATAELEPVFGFESSLGTEEPSWVLVGSSLASLDIYVWKL